MKKEVMERINKYNEEAKKTIEECDKNDQAKNREEFNRIIKAYNKTSTPLWLVVLIVVLAYFVMTFLYHFL